MNLEVLKTASLLTVTSVYTQLYPYCYSVCACPVPLMLLCPPTWQLCLIVTQEGLLETEPGNLFFSLEVSLPFIHTVCNVCMVWSPGSCAYRSQKERKKEKKTIAIPLLHYFLSPIMSRSFQTLFLLFMYFIAIARLSHKPSWDGCISCRWH